MKTPTTLIHSKNRRKMWFDAKNILGRIDKALKISEAYIIGSYASKKKRPADVDIAIVMKVKNGTKNSAWPIDLVIIPESDDTKIYLNDISKWMKNRYKQETVLVKLK